MGVVMRMSEFFLDPPLPLGVARRIRKAWSPDIPSVEVPPAIKKERVIRFSELSTLENFAYHTL